MVQFAQVRDYIFALGRFVGYSLERFKRDGGPRAAAALSYSSLLAIVPLFAIAFALLSAFEGFEDLRIDLQTKLFEAVVPDAALAISDHFATFLDNARRMTGAGVVGLAATAVLLLNTINGAFNAIWRVSEQRPLVFRVLIYWTLLSLGPLLVGASISISTYAFATVQLAGIEAYTRPVFALSGLLPFVFSTLGFALLFIVVPARAIQVRHAVTGALVAAILFELLKKGFGYYLGNFPSYQVIYGALAALPIFLVWMYLSWAVLLIGAEIAAALPEWRAAEARRLSEHGPGARLALALAILGRLRGAARDGQILKESQLANGLPATLEELDDVLQALRRRAYVVRSGTRRWVLSRDLATVTLMDLVRTLGLSLNPGAGWPPAVAAAVAALAEAGAEPGSRSLAELLDQPAGGDDEAPIKFERLA